MRALQKRLEQLVMVHRQLLRKYAQLELEKSEARKLMKLRDDRIAQLDGTCRKWLVVVVGGGAGEIIKINDLFPCCVFVSSSNCSFFFLYSSFFF